MRTPTAVDAARRTLGPVGAVLPVSFTTATPVDDQRAAVARLERAGHRTTWTNEVVGGKDALVQIAMLLAATERMAFGTFIANIWAREPQTAHGAAAALAQGYPGRFALGLGVGYPEQATATGRDFGSPLATMRDYVRRMDEPTWPPAPEVDYPRIVAANGPKMLALSAEISDGALPAGLPAAFTARARELLGPDKLLAVGLAVVLDDDRDRARATARQQAAQSLGRPSYAARMVELGYSDQEIADVADRVVDAMVAHGDRTAVAAAVREHLAAGADHVTLMLPMGTDFAAGIVQLESLSPALLGVD